MRYIYESFDSAKSRLVANSSKLHVTTEWQIQFPLLWHISSVTRDMNSEDYSINVKASGVIHSKPQPQWEFHSQQNENESFNGDWICTDLPLSVAST